MAFILRITEQAIEGKNCVVSVNLESPSMREEAIARVAILLTPEDEERIRWYLEEYLQFPSQPAAKIAENVEQKMQQVGFALFNSIFKHNENGLHIWQQIRDVLSETNFEITVSSEAMIPWELIQNPLDIEPIACKANSFIRLVKTDTTAQQRVSERGAISILLVISRPKGDADVPFRSIAKRLLQYLNNKQTVKIEVLRPPTIDALEDRLQIAMLAGRPFNILHFDGHGVYANLMESHGIKGRKRGYLMFEEAGNSSTPQPVDGRRIGKLLVENKVPVVILNACRSARLEPAAEPSRETLNGTSRSFGSLAEELIKCGVTAVVAMQYNIYVDTAAHFITTLYEHLAQGESLSQAMNIARHGLFKNAERSVAAGAFRLRDWIVPVLFQTQATSLNLFEVAENVEPRGRAVSNLPSPPASGFVGRDNTLLSLDRLFVSKKVVLLWGMMGNGKTSTASEFAKWMLQTGGLTGGVLFTSFKEYKSIQNIVNEAGSVLEKEIKEKGIEWLTVPEELRLQILLEVMHAKSYLWILDNIETLTTKSQNSSIWSAQEVEQFGDFIQKLMQNKVRILLTSRNKLVPWSINEMEDLELSGLQQDDRINLVVSILADPNLFQLDSWQDLLEFSQGNPFVLSLLTRQVIIHGNIDACAMKTFVERLRADSNKNLLDNSIENALSTEFNLEERKILSLCWLFEDVISAPLLDMMIEGSLKINLPSKPMLERGAQLGLFTSIGSSYYSIYPGLLPYFKVIFSSLYPSHEASQITGRFALVYSMIAQSFYNNYSSGNLDSTEVSMQTLKINEINLRHALALSLQHKSWVSGMACLFGLYVLYQHFGRWTEMNRMVEEVLPEYIHVQTNEALPGREELWADFQFLRVEIFRQNYRLSEAERLQQEIVNEKRRAGEESDSNDTAHNSSVIKGHSLAFHLFKLAGIQKDQGLKTCLDTYNDAFEMAQRSGDSNLESDIAYEMANVYMLPYFLNLTEAEYWLQYALDTISKEDRVRYGNIKSMLGSHALLRFHATQPNPGTEVPSLKKAVENLEVALQILPLDMQEARTACLRELGSAYALLGNQRQSISILQQAIKLAEHINDTHKVGQTQLKLAQVYKAAGEIHNSLLFAESALLSFASLAPEAEEELLEVQGFLTIIESQERSQQ